MAKIKVSVSNGNSNTDLGDYAGNKKPYKGISLEGSANIKPSHIKYYAGNKSDYLEQIDVKLTKKSAFKMNLFDINTCDNGKTLVLHIATGSRLTSEKSSRTYTSTKELLLHSSNNSEEIQIKFVVYNYKTGNEKDLYMIKCDGSSGGVKIPVYNELVKHRIGLKKNNFLHGDGSTITADPDTKNGSIIVGSRP